MKCSRCGQNVEVGSLCSSCKLYFRNRYKLRKIQKSYLFFIREGDIYITEFTSDKKIIVMLMKQAEFFVPFANFNEIYEKNELTSLIDITRLKINLKSKLSYENDKLKRLEHFIDENKINIKGVI